MRSACVALETRTAKQSGGEARQSERYNGILRDYYTSAIEGAVISSLYDCLAKCGPPRVLDRQPWLVKEDAPSLSIFVFRRSSLSW